MQLQRAKSYKKALKKGLRQKPAFCNKGKTLSCLLIWWDLVIRGGILALKMAGDPRLSSAGWHVPSKWMYGKGRLDITASPPLTGLDYAPKVEGWIPKQSGGSHMIQRFRSMQWGTIWLGRMMELEVCCIFSIYELKCSRQAADENMELVWHVCIPWLEATPGRSSPLDDAPEWSSRKAHWKRQVTAF